MGVFFIKGAVGLILRGFLESKKCDRRKSDRKLKALIKKSFDLGLDLW